MNWKATIGIGWRADFRDGNKTEKVEIEVRRRDGQEIQHILRRLRLHGLGARSFAHASMAFGVGIILASISLIPEDAKTPAIAWVGFLAVIIGFSLDSWLSWGFKYQRS